MKRLIAVAVLLLTASPDAATQTPAEARIKQELCKIIIEMAEAHSRGDRAVFERYLADDYIGTNINAKKHTKADILAFLPTVVMKSDAPASATSQMFDIKDVDLRRLGDVVVFNYRFDYRTNVEGSPKLVSFRVTDVYTRWNGSWQLKANHRTLIPASQAAVPGGR